MVRLLLLIVGMISSSSLMAGLPETVAKVRKSVVAVGTYLPSRRPPSSFVGTGFVVLDGRYIVTSDHVVSKKIDHEKRETVAIFYNQDGKTAMHKAELVARDKNHDLALLSIDGPALTPLKLGDDSRVREGALYGFTGFPVGMVLGLTPVTHRGIVSAITPVVIPAMSSRKLDAKHIRRMRDPYKVFQLDATAYPGNSGSPLYEAETGKVVGVINSVVVKSTKESALTSPTGITYAIPGRFVKKLIQKAGLSDKY